MRKSFTGAQGAREFFYSSAGILSAIFICNLSLSGASAQGNSASHESQRAAQVRALNNSVLQLHGQFQENPSGSDVVRGQAAQVFARRAAALQALIQEDPHAALTFAFSPELLADLAAKFPASSVLLESQVTLEGTTEYETTDYADPRLSKTEIVLRSGGQTVQLHFAYRLTAPLKGGASVTVEGVVSGGMMAVSRLGGVPSQSAFLVFGTEPARWALVLIPLSFLGSFQLVKAGGKLGRLRTRQTGGVKTAAVWATALILTICLPVSGEAQTVQCSTTGAQNVAVLLVTFPGVTLPSNVTQASLQDIFFATNTPGPSLDGFLREASYGRTSATGGVFGPYTLTGTYSSCSDVGGAVLNDAIAAATAGGVSLQNYSRVFLIFPDKFGCGWAGFGSNACSISATSGNFTASVAYLVAPYVETRAEGVSLASHELGHNFGLLHSGTLSAGGQALGPVTSPGTQADMGDYWSSMGATVMGTYPTAQKSEVLGWMSPGTNYTTVQSNGTFTLQPLETSPAALQALRVQRGTGNNSWLWVEYRQPTDNYDSTLLPQVFSGALIHYEDSATPVGHTYLPNFTPSDTTGNSPALAAGQSWTDPYSNVSILVQSATTTGLTVSVSYGALACTAAAPTVVASPMNPSIYPGQTASYAVSVTDNDSPGCGSSTISLGSSEPSGWSTALSTASVTLAPGQTASMTMGKGAPNGTPAGTYTVNLTAANSSASAADLANATVLTPPSLAVTASVGGANFLPPTSVPLSASVTNGGAAVSGAAVIFKVAGPSGTVSSQTTSTNSTGVATLSYKLNQKSALGTYAVTAQVSLSSGSRKNASTQTATSGPVSFVVQ